MKDRKVEVKLDLNLTNDHSALTALALSCTRYIKSAFKTVKISFGGEGKPTIDEYTKNSKTHIYAFDDQNILVVVNLPWSGDVKDITIYSRGTSHSVESILDHLEELGALECKH